MRKTIVTLLMAVAMMAMGIPTALANSENSNDTAGAGTAECRPGAEDNELISEWEATTMEAYVAELTARFLANHPPEMSQEEIDYIVNVVIPARAQETWDFCDKNLDGILCVLRTEPSPYYYTLLDNRPFDPAA